jgi:hypothetical protein
LAQPYNIGVIQIHWIAAACLFAQTTTPLPKPAPFPTSTPPSTAKPAPQTQKTPAPATVPQDGGTIDPHLAGVPIYPGAELLSGFDGGRGQWVFTFGSDMPFSDITAYYKTQLRSSGTEVFRVPLMQQFDLGQFKAETMTYRPGVVVKDYGSPDSQGYLHVTGITEKRFRTVIQIVPAK